MTASAPRAASAPAAVHIAFLQLESSPRAETAVAAAAAAAVEMVVGSTVLSWPTAAMEREPGARDVARRRKLDKALADPKRSIFG